MTITRIRWYHHLPAATAMVPCDGEDHRISWRRGKLVLLDHDLGSERAMLDLGGQLSGCLKAMQFWGNQFGLPPEQFVQLRQWLGPEAALAPEELDLPREVGMTLSWERAWRHSRYIDRQGKLLERQLKDRAMAPLRAHLTAEKQRFGSRVVRRVEIAHVPAGRPLSMEGRMDTVSVSAKAILSSEWIVDVWSRGLAVVDDAFVLEVVDPAGRDSSRAEVRAVRWEKRPAGIAEPVASTIRAVQGDAGWHVA